MNILSILILSASTLFTCQASDAHHADDYKTYQTAENNPEEDIRLIRTEYSRINALKLKPETFRYETQDCVEGGEISYYTAAGQVVKVSEKGAMDDAVWRREYYYKDGKVFFCFESLNWGAAAGPTITTEYRFYIKEGQSIREMADKKVEPLSEKALEVIARAAKLLEVKSTKDFASVYCK